MDSAIWITSRGEERFVTLRRMVEELGKDLARKERYRCPDERCAVKMITVFPSEERFGGKQIHKFHFRAKPNNHNDVCQRDGQLSSVNHTTTTSSTATGQYEHVSGSNYPVKLVIHSPRRRTSTLTTPGGQPPPSGSVTEPVDDSIHGSHTSELTTGHIRTIVEAFETPPMPLHQMKLLLPECRGKTYNECFANVRNAVNRYGWSIGSHIYYGDYRWHRIYSSGGISIIFAQASPDGRKLGIWVKPELGPRVLRQEILRILASYSQRELLRVYVFGEFRKYRYYKYSVDIEALGQLWITSQTSALLSHHS